MVTKQQLETIQQIPFNIIIIDFPDNGDYYSTPLAIKCMNSWKKVFPNAIFQRIVITQEMVEKENSPYINFFEKSISSYYGKTRDILDTGIKKRILQRISDIFRLVEINKFDNAIYMDVDVYLKPEFINYFVTTIYPNTEFFMGKMLGTFIWNKERNNPNIENIIQYFNDLYFLKYDPTITDPNINFDWGTMEKYYEDKYKYPTDCCPNYSKEAIAGLSFQKDILHVNENFGVTNFLNYKDFINTIDLDTDFKQLEDLIQNHRFKIVSEDSEKILKDCIKNKYPKSILKNIQSFKDVPLKPYLQENIGAINLDFLYLTMPPYKEEIKPYIKNTVVLDICILCCDKDYQNLPTLLDFILNHKTLRKLKISIWDNSEHNKAKDIFKDYVQKYPLEHIKYYSLGYNVYQFEARKKLIENSESDYIWFIDCDDEILEIPDDFLNYSIIYYNYEKEYNVPEVKEKLETWAKKEKQWQEFNVDLDISFMNFDDFRSSTDVCLWDKIIQTNILKYIVTYFIPDTKEIRDCLSEDSFYTTLSFMVANWESQLPMHFSTKRIYKYINTENSISNLTFLSKKYDEFKDHILDFDKMLKLQLFVYIYYSQNWKNNWRRERQVFRNLSENKDILPKQTHELRKIISDIFEEDEELEILKENIELKKEELKKISKDIKIIKEFIDHKKIFFKTFPQLLNDKKEEDVLLDFAKNQFPDFKYWDIIEAYILLGFDIRDENYITN